MDMLSKGKLQESSLANSETSLIAKGMQITKLEVSTLSLQWRDNDSVQNHKLFSIWFSRYRGSHTKTYRISSYGFHGNYYFLKVENVEIFT